MWETIYIFNNFAFMFGLLELECIVERWSEKNNITEKDKESIINMMKLDLLNWYREYCKKESINYNEYELNKIMDFRILDEWSGVLRMYYSVYEKDKIVKETLKKVHTIKDDYIF